MNIFNKCIAYLKDNPEHLWFKRKLYGWGWTPVTWQGWFVILGGIILIVWNFFRLDGVSHSVSDTLRPFFVQTFFIVGVLIFISYKKGEKPRWQWGMPEDENGDKPE